MKKKLFLIFLVFYVLIFLSYCLPVKAIDQADAADVSVTGQVPSPVSKEKSYSTLNTTTTLADPANHPLLLTIYLLDNNQKPVANREVVVVSNRGQVDIIEEISQISFIPAANAAEIREGQKGTTDSEGKVYFRVTSFIPGKATLKILGDSVELKSQTIEFSSLPFPTNLTLTVGLPFSDREIVFFSPRQQETHFSLAQQDAHALSNNETKIKFNFWAVLILVAVILAIPFFIVLNFVNLRKIRWMEKEQTLLLKKMFPPNFNRQS